MRAIAACFALGLLVMGCVETQPPVQRVGNDVLDKTLFDGEWYFLSTVIDTPYGVAYAVVGDQGRLERVEFDIQEEFLVVRRTYDFVADADSQAIAGDAAEVGNPVAIFPIESHFDIRRTYNSVTGETENIIVENDEDRPWNHRQYMRVDWSQNLITDDVLMYARVFDNIEMEPVAYPINDPNHPDAPHYGFDDEGGFDYFDVVGRVLVTPTSFEIDGYRWPTCWFEYQTHVDCAPAEIAIRHSFMRIDPDDDYQPMDYTGDRMERFGYFVTERVGYDPHYGAVEPARRRFVNRHDIWEADYRRDAEGNLIRCTSDLDCDDTRGSVCDPGYAQATRDPRGACTVAYRDRTVRPVAYHLSAGFPEDLMETTSRVVAEWNETLVETVGSLRANECLARGGDDCESERTRDDASVVFTLCHNPVTEDDHAACGEPGTAARIGDLRHSLFGWVPEPSLGAPLGFGPAAADPLTGELVAGTAFIYGAGVEELASHGRDLVAALNGDLDEDTITTGFDIERWVRSVSGPEGRAIPTGAADLDRVSRAIDLSRLTGGRRGDPPPRRRADLAGQRSAAVRSLVRRHAFGTPHASRARLDALRGTPVESALTMPDLSAAAGVDPNLPGGDALYDAASPLRGLSLSARRAAHHARQRLHRDSCVMRARDFEDTGLLGLAQAVQQAATTGDGTMEWYGQRFVLRTEGGAIDYEAVRSMLRHPILHSTGAHEIGHTLGLRHNFAGSYDAVNYRPRYWALRDDGTMRPRPWDPITDAEIAGRQREAQYSTVMDYGNNYLVTDAEGLGYYDHAAIKMGYGDLVEVFTAATDSLEIAWIYFQNLYGWPGPLTYDSFFEGNAVEATHYTSFPALVGGVDGLAQRADVPYRALEPHPTLESDDFIDLPLVDAMGRPAVPYRFCSDELSDIAPDCQLYDAGGDDYESVQSVIDSYWHYYVFHNFRRERLGFDDLSHWDRVYFRYFAKLQSANQVYVFNRTFMDELFGGEDLDAFWRDEAGLGTSTLAVGSAFDLLRRVVTAPEPGGYVAYTLADGTDAYLLDEFEDPEVSVDLVDGRYLATNWDFDAGYYWIDQLDRVGFFIDKVLAIQTLVDPETFILGQDTEADVRGFQINFASTFPEPMAAFVGAILTEDYTAIGPRAQPGGGLVYPNETQIVDRSAPGTPIDPAAGFSVQLFAGAFSMAWIPLTYDDQFFEWSRVWVEGGPEQVTLPPAEVVRFVDPFTSLAYGAGSYPDGGGAETGIGARMLLHATELDNAGALYELDRYLDVIRYQRSLSWYYGFGP